jgi:hypothetical protein
MILRLCFALLSYRASVFIPALWRHLHTNPTTTPSIARYAFFTSLSLRDRTIQVALLCCRVHRAPLRCERENGHSTFSPRKSSLPLYPLGAYNNPRFAIVLTHLHFHIPQHQKLTMALPNVWHHRKVADGSGKACWICYKPTTSVLITPDNKVLIDTATMLF